MTVATFITRMRARQASLFDTTVTVKRFATEGAFDRLTASTTAPTTTTIYTGAGLVRPQQDTTVEAGEAAVAVSDYQVKVPVDTDVQIGDVVTITASTYDASLVNLSLRVSTVKADEWQICRVAMCIDQTVRPT